MNAVLYVPKKDTTERTSIKKFMKESITKMSLKICNFRKYLGALCLIRHTSVQIREIIE